MSHDDTTTGASPPDARLLLAPGCAHCPAVLKALSALVKDGRLGRLEVVNIAAHPEIAAAEGVRSVPWFSIGPFVLTGAHSPRELEDWVDRAAGNTGLATYFGHLLQTDRLPEVFARIQEAPATIDDILLLLGDPETPMSTRIGIGAIIEDLAGSAILADAVNALGHLTESEHQQVRADACHYLGLTGSADAAPWLRVRLDDDDDAVREIAAESLALIHPSESTQGNHHD